LSKNSANLILVRGRRRIGKSRLLAEFGKEVKIFYFLGILIFCASSGSLSKITIFNKTTTILSNKFDCF